MRQCIVIADRARARLFSVEEKRDTPFEEGHRRLREHRDLVNPEGALTDQQLFRDRRAGRRSRSSVGGGGYGLDDGKGRQRQESARRFARELVDATSELLRSRKSKRLLLVASPVSRRSAARDQAGDAQSRFDRPSGGPEPARAGTDSEGPHAARRTRHSRAAGVEATSFGEAGSEEGAVTAKNLRPTRSLLAPGAHVDRQRRALPGFQPRPESCKRVVS